MADPLEALAAKSTVGTNRGIWMQKFALAGLGLALALSACNGTSSSSENGANDANLAGLDNMSVDQNMVVDENMTNGVSAADANAAGADANTQKMMEKDATTHDPDTNLSNGI